MPCTVGIDLALGKTGIVALQGDKVLAECLIDMEKIKQVKGIDRYERIAGTVVDLVAKLSPDAVCIEGYSMASRGVGFLSLVELGGHVRASLRQAFLQYGLEVPLWDVAPGTLKKFTCGDGHGNAQKPEMCMAVFKRWGYEAPRSDDNLVDAYALARSASVLRFPELHPKASAVVLSSATLRFR